MLLRVDNAFAGEMLALEVFLGFGSTARRNDRLTLQLAVTRHVAADAKGHRVLGVDLIVDAADHVSHPCQAVLQDPRDAALERVRRDGTTGARSLKLHFDDAGLDVGADEHQVTTVGLDGGAHQVQERIERLETRRSFLVGQLFHGTSLP